MKSIYVELFLVLMISGSSEAQTSGTNRNESPLCIVDDSKDMDGADGIS